MFCICPRLYQQYLSSSSFLVSYVSLRIFFLSFSSFLFFFCRLLSNLPNLTQNKRLVPPKGLSVHGSSHVVDMFPLSPDQTRPDQTRPKPKPKPSCARSRSPGNSTIHILCVYCSVPPTTQPRITRHPSPITHHINHLELASLSSALSARASSAIVFIHLQVMPHGWLAG